MSRLTNYSALREDDAFDEAITGNKTLDAADSGKRFRVTETATITLPATAVGIYYHLENDGLEDGDVQITVSPNANDKIEGVDLTGTDNKNIINTLATAKRGDRVVLIGNGAAGWSVAQLIGTWAEEA